MTSQEMELIEKLKKMTKDELMIWICKLSARAIAAEQIGWHPIATYITRKSLYL